MRDTTVRTTGRLLSLGRALLGVLLGCAPSAEESSDVSDTGVDVAANPPEVVQPADGAVVAPSLTFSPSPVVFGKVPSGQTVQRWVQLSTIGATDAWVSGFAVEPQDAEFLVVGTYDTDDAGGCSEASRNRPAVLPLRLQPGGNGLCVAVNYTSFDPADDSALLVAKGALGAEASSQPLAVVALQGFQVAPRVEVSPAPLDFGPVDFGQTKDLALVIHNAGNELLVVDAVAKGASDVPLWADVTLLAPVAPGTPVAPSGDLVVPLRLAVTQDYAGTLAAIGRLLVQTNDPVMPKVEVAVFGGPVKPRLAVSPEQIVDFGVVNPALPAERTLVLRNVGVSELQITQLSFPVDGGGGYALAQPPNLPLSIAAGQQLSLQLQFTNAGGPNQEVVSGTFRILSNNPAGAVDLELVAMRTDQSYCKLELDTSLLDFGVVAAGTTHTLPIGVTNVGSAPCSPLRVAVVDGESTTAGTSATCSAPLVLSDASAGFEVLAQLPGIKDYLQPGQTATVDVRFQPSAAGFPGSLGAYTGHTGLLQVVMLDYAQLAEFGEPLEVRAPSGSAGDPVTCNLVGWMGPPALRLFPSEHTFDVTTVGCSAPSQTVTLTNLSPKPVRVCDVTFSGSCDAFAVTGLPDIPPCTADGAGGYMLSKEQSLTLSASYAPTTPGTHDCVLRVLSGEPDTTLALYGSASSQGHPTDHLAQIGPQPIDVLFVVDAISAAEAARTRLAQALPAFFAQAATWAADYHVGVIASDFSSGLSGRLVTADADSPRFATTALGFEGLSTAINGLADGGLSQGMEAALTAVTPPLTLDPVGAPPLVCTEDSGCPPSVACVPSVLEPGLSHCMGLNGQFLRHDAALHVVFVSSVTDSSGKAVTYYASALRSVVSDPSRFQAHAIVGDLPQGCVGPGIIAAGSARYTALANTTGGLVMSVCAPDWAPLLTELGERVFGWTLRTAFPLTRRPVESTITVMVAGTACTQGWSYDAAQNAVVFDPGGPCMPQFEEAVVIDYDAVCGALP